MSEMLQSLLYQAFGSVFGVSVVGFSIKSLIGLLRTGDSQSEDDQEREYDPLPGTQRSAPGEHLEKRQQERIERDRQQKRLERDMHDRLKRQGL